MSRIGRKPIEIPAGVTVRQEGEMVIVNGPKGTLTEKIHPRMTLQLEQGKALVTRPTDEKQDRALHGLTRTLLNNMVHGVTNGYEKRLEIEGVGYKAEKQGKRLVLNLGYSHPIYFEETGDITYEVPSATVILVKGPSKQMVGQLSAQIRGKRPPEPYLGKGIRYAGEKIRRKAGKAGK
ncbi:MAG: 50S ribosomal protein L6 [Eubacteriales bacterium]